MKYMIKPIEKQQYHKFWRENNGCINQSWAWGELKSSSGWGVERLGMFDGEELVAVVSVYLKTFPFSSITKLLGFEKFAYIPRGLVTGNAKQRKNVLDELNEYYKDKVAFILIDPEKNLFDEEWNEGFEKQLLGTGYRPSGVTIQPNQTDIIDITKSEEDLMAAMKPKWRRNIRKSVRQGVSVSEVTGREGIAKFYSVISSVEKNTKFVAHNLEYFEKMWDELSKDELIRIFVAEYNGQVVAAYLVVLGEKVAYEIYGGATSKGRDCEASYLLKWEIIKRLSKDGYKYYDQWGAAPKGDLKHPLAGVSYFKSGFGGEYVEYLPQHVKVFNSLGYLLYKLKRAG
jgi:peptidoglycan pentaglycine glycine transferase (the first glycine)